MVRTSLAPYRKKRNFTKTSEPAPEHAPKQSTESGLGPGGRFVVHEHHASRLHFDLRLEMGGVLKSYAVPKGPSLNPKDRRLAINTEDHPVKYLTFEGSIGDGQYGAGQMVIWDTGVYSVPPGEDPLDQWEKGMLHLHFNGQKLRGGFMLIKTSHSDRQWLLFKKKDEDAEDDWQPALILPYGARTEKPKGFIIPAEALRSSKDWQPVVKAAGKAAKFASAADIDLARKSTRKPSVKPVKSPVKTWPVGVKSAPLPETFAPMLATLADKPFDDPDWIFETKWDGWRALLRKDENGITLISRSGKNLNTTFPELLTLGDAIKAGSCMLDGEIVALDDEGMPRFQLLQNRLKGKGAKGVGRGHIVYYAFDLPHCEGKDLTAASLIDRKSVLKKILPNPKAIKAPGRIRYSDHFEARGKDVFAEAVRLGLEGVVAKLKKGIYRHGRSAEWLKLKSRLRQEVVIAGYTEPRGSRLLFGSLVVGMYQGKEFHFAGHVGGGFNAKLLKEVLGFMTPLEKKACPFVTLPKTNEKVQWLAPELVAEVEFAEWTEEGRLRQPIFMGLRPDKDAKECLRETAEPEALLRETAKVSEKNPRTGTKKDSQTTTTGPVITHPEKILFPGEKVTKADLVAYYRTVSPYLLPHLQDRPLILKRFPNGIDAPAFYQHDVKSAPDFVKTLPIPENDGTLIHYALCQNLNTLLWLANLAVIPQNPWLSRTPNLHQPDWIVFDLDPQEVAFPEVCSMALYLKEMLEGLGLKVFAKTSGSRGIHIYVPLKPRYDFSQGLAFAQLIGALAVRNKPGDFTVDRSLKIRKRNRIYLDCMQNSEGKSVASVYSVRERPGANVSAPVEWPELKRKIQMEDFNIRTMPARLEKKGDLFQDVLKTKNTLEGALKKLGKLL